MWSDERGGVRRRKLQGVGCEEASNRTTVVFGREESAEGDAVSDLGEEREC